MEQMLNIKLYKDNKDIILVIKDATPNIENVVMSTICSLCNSDAHPTTIKGIAPVVEKEETPSIDTAEDFTPDFLTTPIDGEENKEEVVVDEPVTEKKEDFANHVVTMNGKYATSGFTIQQIYEKDVKWIEFMANNSRSRHPDAEKIKIFYASKQK